jgi:hypothetical protein
MFVVLTTLLLAQARPEPPPVPVPRSSEGVNRCIRDSFGNYTCTDGTRVIRDSFGNYTIIQPRRGK